MYAVTIFDRYGAVLLTETFDTWEAAIKWMCNHCTGVFGKINDYGEFGPTHWQLYRRDR